MRRSLGRRGDDGTTRVKVCCSALLWVGGGDGKELDNKNGRKVAEVQECAMMLEKRDLKHREESVLHSLVKLI